MTSILRKCTKILHNQTLHLLGLFNPTSTLSTISKLINPPRPSSSNVGGTFPSATKGVVPFASKTGSGNASSVACTSERSDSCTRSEFWNFNSSEASVRVGGGGGCHPQMYLNKTKAQAQDEEGHGPQCANMYVSGAVQGKQAEGPSACLVVYSQ